MKHVIEDYVNIWNTQNTERLSTIFISDAIYKDSQQEGNAITTIRNSIQSTVHSFPNVSFHIRQLIESKHDTSFVLLWEMTGTHKGDFFGIPPTHKTIKISGTDVIRFSNHKISTLESFYDTTQFITQLEA